jgi:DNA-binding NarL/FixJ family response regulator
MPSMIRIVIAEDDLGLCELFREQLSVVRDFTVVGEARSGREAISAVGRLEPDVLTLDIDLPEINGLEVLPVVRWCSPSTKVIVLSSHDEETTIMKALELGAGGYIVKGDGTNLEKAIRAVQRGEVWARRRVLARVLDHLRALAGRPLQEAEGKPAPA